MPELFWQAPGVNMKASWTKFLKDDAGAITVDWVVLTAALIGIGMVVLMPVAFEADSASAKIGDEIGEQEIGYKKSQ